MITVVIKNDGEPKVIQLTYQNLWKELKDIPGAELKINADWFEELPKTKNTFICFVEADCLVSSGYFASMLGLFNKSRMLRKLAMMSSSTGVENWANKFYGYSIQKAEYGDDELSIIQPVVQPNKEMKSRGVYPVQIGYMPGSLIRVATLKNMLNETNFNPDSSGDLVYLSTQISLGFWRHGDGNRVHLNPNSAYVTTEKYVNDLGQFDPQASDVMEKFEKELI
jgi:hypothetical protein